MNPVVGITAEYNPFHLGHLAQVEEVRRTQTPEAIVAVLSSHFTQRGLPALTEPRNRAEAAVRCGVDLVLELPEPFCCHNAGVFASAAVAILKATGVVDTLCFGMESPDAPLIDTASILVQESPAFKTALRSGLDRGLSYASARAHAAVGQIGDRAAELLTSPNNTLAVAYAEAALRQNWSPRLLPVARQGGAYLDEDIGVPKASATAVRAAFARGDNQAALAQLPAPSAALTSQALTAGRAVTTVEALWPFLDMLLRRETVQSLATYAEFGEGIEHAVLAASRKAHSFEDLVERLTTRRYPRTRLRRQLLHFVLGLRHEDNRAFQAAGPRWLHPLAANEAGRRLLARMRSRSTLPLVHRWGDVPRDALSQTLMDFTLRCARIWERLLPSPSQETSRERFELRL